MSDYPRLMWGPHGDEVTVCSAAEQEMRQSDGYRLTQAERAPEPVPAPEPEPVPEPEPNIDWPSNHRRKRS